MVCVEVVMINVNNVIQQINNIEFNEEPVPMKTGKARSWLGEYHYVKPKGLASDPEKMQTDPEMREWCVQHFGKSGQRWFEQFNKFYFKNEEDMTMFILRWS